MFSVHTTPKEFKNATINHGHFGFVFEENSGREYYGYRNVVVFEKHRFQNVFRPHKRKAGVFNRKLFLQLLSQQTA